MSDSHSFISTSLKINSRKKEFVVFLPLCYQFCDMIFFSLIKRLMQKWAPCCEFCGNKNAAYNDNTASGLTSRNKGNEISPESNGQIK